MAKVGIVMGSDSDMPVMAKAAEILDKLGIDYEMKIISAHREPDVFFEYAKSAEEKGFKVIIAGAGKAAHLPGMCAGDFPDAGDRYSHEDVGSRRSGFPVLHRGRCPAVFRWLRLPSTADRMQEFLQRKFWLHQMLPLLERLKDYSRELKEQVEQKDAKLQEVGWKNY